MKDINLSKVKMAKHRSNIFFSTLYVVVFVFTSINCSGQTEKITINGKPFIIKSSNRSNEWETIDSIKTLYLIEGENEKTIIDYFKFQDNGGDCNNLFWTRESLKVQHDSIIINSHYFQKTGLDPIPEYRKRIYRISSGGKMTLIYDKQKFYHQTDW